MSREDDFDDIMDSPDELDAGQDDTSEPLLNDESLDESADDEVILEVSTSAIAPVEPEEQERAGPSRRPAAKKKKKAAKPKVSAKAKTKPKKKATKPARKPAAKKTAKKKSRSATKKKKSAAGKPRRKR